MSNSELSSSAIDSDRRAIQDRRQKRLYRFMERRTGFDRRRSYPLTSRLREDPTRLFLLLIVSNGLSALDFLFTLAQLRAGVATEANPVLAELFSQGPVTAWAFKSSVMLLVSLIIWFNRKHRAILSVALIMLAAYTLLVTYHIAVSQALGLI